MSDMIEKVARAICISCCEDPDAWATQAGVSQTNWKTFISNAIAAIEAMRMPTDAMISEGGESIPSDGIRPDRDRRDAEEVWRTMIEAALSPPPPISG